MGSRRIASVLAAALLGLLAVTSCHLGDDMLKAVADVRAGFKVAPPEFSAAAGDYTNDFTFTLSCPTDEASIRYTVDGSPPRSDYGVQYQGAPIPVNGTTTFKAVAYKPKWNDSAVTTTLYRMMVADPAIAPPGGIYGSAQSVTLSCTTVGASLRYTIDDPDLTPTTGVVFTAPFAISDTKTVRALACKANYSNSQVVQATYSIGKCSAPLFTPSSGTYAADTAVEISSGTSGTEIYYTTDGATPTLASPHGPIPVTVTVTKTATVVKAFATHPSLSNSDIAVSGTFTLKVADPTFSPTAGTYTGSQSVTIDSSTTGRTLRYTTNGSDPTTGTIYTIPVSVSSNLTLRAIATKTDYDPSAIADAAYTIKYTLTMANDGHGTTTPSGTTAVVCGSPTAISATAATGYHFLNWTTVPPSDPDAVFGDANSASTTVTLTGDATAKANFAINQYTLTMTNDGHGTTTPSGTPSVNHGAATAISASASASYCFSEWVATVNPGSVTFGDATAASTTVALTGPATMQARFTNHAFVSSAGSASNTGRSASSPKKTVADGISVAQSNSLAEVWVSQGTYPVTTYIIMVGGISLRGGWNNPYTAQDREAYATTISASTAMTLISINGTSFTSSTKLEGFHLSVSTTTGGTHPSGVSISGGACPTIANNHIVISDTSATSDCSYGIYVADAATSPTITDNIIVANRANATATDSARAVHVIGHTSGTLIIQRNRITANANNRADGIRMPGSVGTQIVRNNVISVRSTSSMAIGITLDGACVVASNNTIVVNSGSQYGVYHNCSASSDFASYFTNDIFCTPAGSSSGYGVFRANTSFGPVHIKGNLTFMLATPYTTGGTTFFDDGSNSDYTSSQIFTSVFSGTYDGTLSDGDDTNYYVNTLDTTYAYNKAVDASGPTFGSVTDDIQGEARPKGGAWDRGCDER